MIYGYARVSNDAPEMAISNTRSLPSRKGASHVDRQTTFDGFTQVGEPFVHGFASGGATGNGGDLRPISPAILFVNDSLDVHEASAQAVRKERFGRGSIHPPGNMRASTPSRLTRPWCSAPAACSAATTATTIPP
jgi:hypothetical protein